MVIFWAAPLSTFTFYFSLLLSGEIFLQEMPLIGAEELMS
jgi:hypothetical protein